MFESKTWIICNIDNTEPGDGSGHGTGTGSGSSSGGGLK